MSIEKKQYFEVDITHKKNETENLEEALQATSEDDISFFQLVFPDFKLMSFSFFISAFQIFFYFFTLFYYFISNDAWECVLYNFGATFEPSIRYHYEIHRFIMPIFLHYNFHHLITNVLLQFMILFHLEENYSTKVTILIYFFSNWGGNILSNMVYWHFLKMGASLAIMGCFAFELLHLLNKHHEIIFKSKFRFTITCLLCSILALPMLRVYDNRNKIRNQRNLKLLAFYGLIFLYFLIYIILSIYNGIDNEKAQEKPEKDPNFHWRILELSNDSNQKKIVIIDNLGHLGSI